MRWMRAKGPGRPLSDASRQYFEVALRHRFQRRAAARGTVGGTLRPTPQRARPFVYGPGIWLGAGEREADRALLAHELVHVVQQEGGAGKLIQCQTRGSAPSESPLSITDPGELWERFQTLKRTKPQEALFTARVLLDRAAAADLVDRGLELFLWLLDRGEPALVRRALEATRMGVLWNSCSGSRRLGASSPAGPRLSTSAERTSPTTKTSATPFQFVERVWARDKGAAGSNFLPLSQFNLAADMSISDCRHRYPGDNVNSMNQPIGHRPQVRIGIIRRLESFTSCPRHAKCINRLGRRTAGSSEICGKGSKCCAQDCDRQRIEACLFADSLRWRDRFPVALHREPPESRHGCLCPASVEC